MPDDAPALPKSFEEIELSIVMPCLDEAETIVRCIEKARSWLEKKGVRGEIIVADNGSRDDSSRLAAGAGARVVPVVARGYGHALRAGIVAARGKFIIMGDADDSYDFTDLSPFCDKLREGYDFVMGNRFGGGIRPGAMPPLHRYFGNPLLSGLSRLFFRSPCRDAQCGLRAFRKEAIERLELRTTGMEFAAEMVVKATLHKLRICEVPVVLHPAGRSRAPHLRSWRDGWRHLRFLLLYSPRWLFFYPGVLLMTTGFVAGLWLLPGPVFVENIGFDVQTLLYAAMAMVLGFQAIVFAVFSKAFAIRARLLPQDPRFMKIFRSAGLESGIFIGLLLLCAGLAGSIWAVFFWKAHSFGRLDPSSTLRIIIPSVTALTLGFQIILSSFFLSVLGLSAADEG